RENLLFRPPAPGSHIVTDTRIRRARPPLPPACGRDMHGCPTAGGDPPPLGTVAPMRSRCPTVRALRLGATTRKPVRAVPGLAAIIAVLAGLLAAAEPMPVACTPVGEADIIIVLGGAGPPRAARAAALHHAGIAPLVLV